jgi:molecular chaperone GrpE
MSKHTSQGQQEGGNSRPEADPATPEGDALPRQEDPGTEAALNEEAGAQDADPEKAAKGPEAARGNLSPEQNIVELEAQLARKGAELTEAKDQLLRKAADFENSRKRMNREKQDAIDFANQSLLLDLIPILDDFDRALEVVKATVEQGEGSARDCKDQAEGAPLKDLRSFHEGFEMIAKRLSSTLETKWGLKAYTAAGEPFDPNRHEALMMEKSAEVAEQTVQQDLLKGYTLKDRVIRSAKVKVLVPVAGPAGDGAGEDKALRADLDSQNEIKQEKE